MNGYPAFSIFCFLFYSVLGFDEQVNGKKIDIIWKKSVATPRYHIRIGNLMAPSLKE